MSDIAVAISTTGDPHRLRLLAYSVGCWRGVMAEHNQFVHNPNLFVTVDGDINAVDRVVDAIGYEPVPIYQVGQPTSAEAIHVPREGRLGVAVNKNTGIELMMDETDAAHLFLSDDDIWPLNPRALDFHVSGNGLSHSMVCWGQHRLLDTVARTPEFRWASWSWPRGSMIYTHRSV